MSVCPDCNKLNVNDMTTLQDEEGACQRFVHETVCVQGTVMITPSLVSGTSTSYCIGNPIIGICEGELKRRCVFTVSQNICVEIPLTFSATAEATPNGLVCGDVGIGICQGTGGCTHTRGFFANNETVVAALLEAGPIVLGIDADGFSFTVTTLADAQAVYTNAVPGSPNSQYNQLYAQLLTADLNVRILMEQGIEICPFALDAIAAANDLLAMEEIQPNGVVSGIQEELEEFNAGNAPGCPVHCE
jgi:hypothetical protein